MPHYMTMRQRQLDIQILNKTISIEIVNLAWKLQSRLKFTISTFRISHKNGALVGGSLEISIPEADLEFFQSLRP